MATGTMKREAPSQFYGAPEVMESLGLKCQISLRRAIDRGDIPAPIRIGKRRLWHRNTWDAFVDGSRVEKVGA